MAPGGKRKNRKLLSGTVKLPALMKRYLGLLHAFMRHKGSHPCKGRLTCRHNSRVIVANLSPWLAARRFPYPLAFAKLGMDEDKAAGILTEAVIAGDLQQLRSLLKVGMWSCKHHCARPLHVPEMAP
eukprot:1155773-Pelagomonas_calceolata.AAC.7